MNIHPQVLLKAKLQQAEHEYVQLKTAHAKHAFNKAWNRFDKLRPFAKFWQEWLERNKDFKPF